MRSSFVRQQERAISRPLPTLQQMHVFLLLPQQFAGTCRDPGFAILLPRDVFAEVARASQDLLLRKAKFARTCRDAGFAALLPRDVFIEVAHAMRDFLLRKRRARMRSLDRRRTSSRIVHDSNFAEGLFVAFTAALRCFRSAIALVLAVFFIQRVNPSLSPEDTDQRYLFEQ